MTFEKLRVPARHLDPADIGGNDHEVLEFLFLEIITEYGDRIEMVHRDIEKALDLPRVEVHGEHAVSARAHDEVRHQLRGDRNARPVLTVLARVTKERKHGRNALS